MSAPSCQQLMAVRTVDEQDNSFEWKKYIPVGFKFEPTDQELIRYYLQAKVSNNIIFPGIVADINNIYTHEPQDLHKFAFKHDNGRMYFFSSVKRKDNSKTKNQRTVLDKGFWKASTARKEIPCTETNVNIGSKASLVYNSVDHKFNKRISTKCNWLMHEYRLPEKESNKEEEQADKEYVTVLSVIYFFSKSKKD